MVYKKTKIDGENITLCAEEEDAWITVLVNDNDFFDLPLVYNGRLTIKLTVAGLAALEKEGTFRHENIATLEFLNYD